jgi:hypothetical protein
MVEMPALPSSTFAFSTTGRRSRRVTFERLSCFPWLVLNTRSVGAEKRVLVFHSTNSSTRDGGRMTTRSPASRLRSSNDELGAGEADVAPPEGESLGDPQPSHREHPDQRTATAPVAALRCVRHLALAERAQNYLAQGKKGMLRKDLERILAEDSSYEGVRERLAELS